MRLELTCEGLLVGVVNHYTTRDATIKAKRNSVVEKKEL